MPLCKDDLLTETPPEHSPEDLSPTPPAAGLSIAQIQDYVWKRYVKFEEAELLDEEEAGRLGVDGVAAGQALVCLRDLDLVVTLDLDAGRFTWLSRGPLASPWRAPHDPSVAADGSLLVFDNRGGPAESSRLLLVDPGSAAIRWRWQAAPPSAFASFFCGTVQQLPGGNLLVAESTQGRAFELDPGTGEVVWDYVSPRTTGEAGELIAALFMAERVAAPAWLER